MSRAPARRAGALRVARRDGHSRPAVQAHRAAHRRGARARCGRLFSLTVEQLVSLERFAEKSAEQLVAAIEESKQRPLSRLLNGLGIRHVGEGAAAAPRAPLRQPRRAHGGHGEEIVESVRGIGDIIARSVVEYFAEPNTRKLMEKLRKARAHTYASQRQKRPGVPSQGRRSSLPVRSRPCRGRPPRSWWRRTAAM